jgi:hypothetical protein
MWGFTALACTQDLVIRHCVVEKHGSGFQSFNAGFAARYASFNKITTVEIPKPFLAGTNGSTESMCRPLPDQPIGPPGGFCESLITDNAITVDRFNIGKRCTRIDPI